LVDKTAYATVLGNISDCGILVVAVNLDPLRLSGTITTNPSPCKMVMKIGFEIERLLGISVQEWIFMSHGEGACAVSNLVTSSTVASLKPTKCILWSPTSFMHDLRSSNGQVLVIQAGENSELLHSNRYWIERKLPIKSSRFENVIGGSHSGFAHYGPATFRSYDENRSKSLDDQQSQVRNISVDFILKEKNI